MFFGALRIRKEQDAAEQSLARRRPAVSIIVWDAIKNRMDEALERVRKYVTLCILILLDLQIDRTFQWTRTERRRPRYPRKHLPL